MGCRRGRATVIRRASPTCATAPRVEGGKERRSESQETRAIADTATGTRNPQEAPTCPTPSPLRRPARSRLSTCDLAARRVAMDALRRSAARAALLRRRRRGRGLGRARSPPSTSGCTTGVTSSASPATEAGTCFAICCSAASSPGSAAACSDGVRPRRRRDADQPGHRVRGRTAKAPGHHAEKPVVSRSHAEQPRAPALPRSSTASRSAASSPSRSRPPTAGSAGPARAHGPGWLPRAFVVVYLVPFLKYPANPPSVGDPDTIGKRTALVLHHDR